MRLKDTPASCLIASGPATLLASGCPFDRLQDKGAPLVTKSQLIEAVAARTDLTRRQAADAVDAVLETMEDVLSRGGEVALAGFGKFSVAERAARSGQHPRTGETMDIPASRVPKFTAGSNLKQAVRR
jgi:DNA-binding protein HU-beta